MKKPTVVLVSSVDVLLDLPRSKKAWYANTRQVFVTYDNTLWTFDYRGLLAWVRSPRDLHERYSVSAFAAWSKSHA